MLNAIFDFNGTMFFDETFQEKAWQQYMTEKLGRRITPEEFQTWVHGRNTGDTLEYFFGRPFTQQEADEEELVAVIGAAAAAFMGCSTDRIIVRNVRRLQEGAPNWAKAGLMEQMRMRKSF